MSFFFGGFGGGGWAGASFLCFCVDSINVTIGISLLGELAPFCFHSLFSH